jgi:hypothetical protein
MKSVPAYEEASVATLFVKPKNDKEVFLNRHCLIHCSSSILLQIL